MADDWELAFTAHDLEGAYTKGSQEALKTASEKWTARTARAELECERLRGIIVRLMTGDPVAQTEAKAEADEIVELYIR